MSKGISLKGRFVLSGKILILAALAAAVVLSGKPTGLRQGHGLIFVLLGGAALGLMSFSLAEIGAAIRHAAGVPASRSGIRTSCLFWEASSRNFWMLGVLASVMSFVNSLNSISGSSGGIADVAYGMAASLVPSVYGFVLAAVCLVPAWKLGRRFRRQPPEVAQLDAAESDQIRGAFWRLETVLGYFLFIVMLAWTAFKPFLSAPSLSFKPWAWFIYWPAALIILGGTLAFVLFVGDAAAGAPLTVSFALTALIGSLMGFIQVLLGFASKDGGSVAAGRIASAMAFIISSCFIGLSGMILVGAPLEDRMVKSGRIDRPPALSRVSCWVFPLVALIFLVMTFFLVITPVRK